VAGANEDPEMEEKGEIGAGDEPNGFTLAVGGSAPVGKFARNAV